MKVSLVYPKIPSAVDCPLKKCVAFEKIDGTNMHWVWTGDAGGWIAFGTRRHQYKYREELLSFCNDHPELVGAVQAFELRRKHLLEELFKAEGIQRAIVFTEYNGAGSFAGQHKKDDGSKEHTIIDIQVDGKFAEPESFVRLMERFPLPPGEKRPLPNVFPKVVYKGKFNGQFIEDVRKGKYKVAEGVVCKGVHKGEIYMVKIKTNAYMERLKTEFKDEWKSYWE